MNWKSVALLPDSSLEDALKVLDRTAMQIILVVSEQDQLLGTLTDGDIRRALLKGSQLSNSIESFMNLTPTTAHSETLDTDLLDLMRRLGIKSVPILNSENEVLGLKFLETLSDVKIRNNPVLIMAGGRGERLKPFTDLTPKPLLTVAGQPLIEILLKRLSNQGFRKIWISVHYRAIDIIEVIGNGQQFGLNIQYLHEEIPLGTAGALSLLPLSEITDPILVCNADLLNGADFGSIVDHHVAMSAIATITVSHHLTEIPYGVILAEAGRLRSLEEKPIRKDLISAGINVFNPEVLSLFPEKKKLNMPDIYARLLKEEAVVSVYELEGYWRDVGTTNSMKQAEIDHATP